MRDGLERAVLLLTELSELPANASKVEIKNAIMEHNAALKAHKEQLTNMVPYRALAGFSAIHFGRGKQVEEKSVLSGCVGRNDTGSDRGDFGLDPV